MAKLRLSRDALVSSAWQSLGESNPSPQNENLVS